ncbi:MAG: phosphatidate cytidylyltransferase, partial [Actinobacteria bacterium]|nr:phosphatidate cytidylyltransferase [Actinomycetota bacterium]
MSTPTGSDQSRTGRNLPLATAVGVVLFAVFALSIWFKPLLFVLLVSAVMLLAVAELTRAVAPELSPRIRKLLLVATPALILSAYLGGPIWLLASW